MRAASSVLHGCLVLTIICTVGPPDVRAHVAGEMLTRPGSGAAKDCQLSCECHIRVLMDGFFGSKGEYRVAYQVAPPDRIRIQVESQSVEDLFHSPTPPPEGTQYVLDNSQLQLYNPMTGTNTVELPGPREAPPIRITAGPDEFPDVRNYVSSVTRVLAPPPPEMTSADQVGSTDNKYEVLSIQFEDPVKVFEPHAISKFVWWWDRQRSVPIHGYGYNKEGSPVVEVWYGDIREVRVGVWRALATDAKVEEGRAELHLQSHEEYLTTSVWVPGYTVHTDYLWEDEWNLKLPMRRVYEDTKQQTVCIIEFLNYSVSEVGPSAQE